jgi:hypothetical protein
MSVDENRRSDRAEGLDDGGKGERSGKPKKYQGQSLDNRPGLRVNLGRVGREEKGEGGVRRSR